MIFGTMIALIALAFFAASNLFAVGVSGFGIVILIALRLRRKAEFWPLLLAMTCFCGGAGALGVSWGAYFCVSRQTPDWGYAVLAWIVGYLLGGVGGVLLAIFGVSLRRRGELPHLEHQLKMGFANYKNQLSTLGFQQMLRVGAYSLRLTFSKR